MDRQARLVWALVTPENHWTIYMRQSYDGDDILWDQATYWADYDSGTGSQVHRMKIDGTIVQSYATPGLHHAFTERADGTLVWGAASWDDEALVHMLSDGTVETLWSCDDFQQMVNDTGHCQSNSLYWHEPSDTYLYSFYSFDSVVEVEAATGYSLRWWGHVDGAWDFDPHDSAFWWQHGATYTDAGNLLLSTQLTDDSDVLVVREYELDRPGQVLRQVWSFGEDQGLEGSTAGEAHRLPNGNTLHNFGAGSRMREITPDGQVVWDVAWKDERLLGRTIFVEDLYVFAP